MKIKKIELSDYQQFKPKLNIDLTYPKGHEKEGQPLEKVCIIGQSGTGKTTLLNIIKLLAVHDKIVGNGEIMPVPSDGALKAWLQIFDLEILRFINEGKVAGKYLNDGYFKEKGLKSEEVRNKYLKKIEPYLIYYPAEVIKNFGRSNNRKLKLTFKDDKADIVGSILDPLDQPKKKTKFEYVQEEAKFGNIINFGVQNASDIWSFIDKDIVSYREEEIKLRLKISELAQKPQVSPDEIIQASEDFKKWQKQKFNPIKDLADNCLDKILNEFGLRVRTQLDFHSKEDIEFIKIETLEGKEVPLAFLSTGSKQLVLTALPLYVLEPRNTIILFDEPERSLYPDIQTKLIPFYTAMAVNSQFFFATHSPILAASFEPWEIVELKFDEKDHLVYREDYFKGERHVDNYFIDPRFLRWDSILQKIFDLPEEGNSDERTPKLMELATLKSKIQKLKSKKNSNDQEKINELWEQYKKLANLLDWKIEGVG